MSSRRGPAHICRYVVRSRNIGRRCGAAAGPLRIGQSVRVTSGAAIELREATPEDDDAVVALMTAYLTWAHTILRDQYGVEEPPTDPSRERDSLAALRRPSGMTVLAERGGRAIGVGAVRGLNTDVAEIKRMYVDPAARGLHAGSAVLDRLLNDARRAGVKNRAPGYLPVHDRCSTALPVKRIRRTLAVRRHRDSRTPPEVLVVLRAPLATRLTRQNCRSVLVTSPNAWV